MIWAVHWPLTIRLSDVDWTSSVRHCKCPNRYHGTYIKSDWVLTLFMCAYDQQEATHERQIKTFSHIVLTSRAVQIIDKRGSRDLKEVIKTSYSLVRQLLWWILMEILLKQVNTICLSMNTFDCLHQFICHKILKWFSLWYVWMIVFGETRCSFSFVSDGRALLVVHFHLYLPIRSRILLSEQKFKTI